MTGSIKRSALAGVVGVVALTVSLLGAGPALADTGAERAPGLTGITQLEDITEFNGQLYVVGINDGDWGLFRYDGAVLTSIPLPAGVQGPYMAKAVGSYLYLDTAVGTLQTIYAYDGTDFHAVTNAGWTEDDELYFAGTSPGSLYLINVVDTGDDSLIRITGLTSSVVDLDGAEPERDNFAYLDGKVYVRAETSASSFASWYDEALDSAEAVPALAGYESPRFFTVAGDTVYFTYWDSASGIALASFDGTTATSIPLGAVTDIFLDGAAELNGMLYFFGRIGTETVLLHVDAAGTLVSESMGGVEPSHYRELAAYDGRLYFAGSGSGTGDDILFSFDGTSIVPVPGSPENVVDDPLITAGGALYFMEDTEAESLAWVVHEIAAPELAATGAEPPLWGPGAALLLLLGGAVLLLARHPRRPQGSAGPRRQ